MIKNIRFECSRVLSSRMFRISLCLSCAFAAADVIQNLYYRIINMNQYSVFEKWMGSQAETFGAVAFYWVFPLLASLPYAWSLCDELHGGYAAQVMVRTGKKEYFAGKLISSFLSGGTVIACPLILDLLLLMMLNRTFYPTPNDLISCVMPGSFCSVLYYTHPVLFVLLWTCVEFLWGGTFALLCCALGFYIKKTVILLPSMLLIYVAESILSEFIIVKRNWYNIEFAWQSLTRADTMALNPGWVIFGSIGLILLVSFILTLIKGAKYEVL